VTFAISWPLQRRIFTWYAHTLRPFATVFLRRRQAKLYLHAVLFWHRDRGVTMLVRVDISAGTNGVLSVALSHQAAGFAPYRIDNCTAATLHLRQARHFPNGFNVCQMFLAL